MSLAEIFEETMEDLEEVTLQTLIVGLCEKGRYYAISGSPDEKRFLKIVSLLLGMADYRTRAGAAEHICEIKGLPGEIYLYFASDDIMIARLFLEPSFPLSTDDMLHIVRHTTTAHRLELVKRHDLPPEVVQAVMLTNEVNVIRAMNENEENAVFYEYDDSLPVDDRARGALDGYDDGQGEKAVKENPLSAMLQLYSEKSRFVDIIELIARTGQLPKETVKELFSKKDAGPISILCKGLGVSEEAFGALAQFRCRRLGQLERLADNAREAYPEIDPEFAKAMLVDLQGQAVRLVRSRAAG